MNLMQAVGVIGPNTDSITHEELSHEEVYDRIIDYLGGLSAVAPYIPFEISKIRKALKTDKHLNNLTLRKWDEAAGFTVDGPDAGPNFRNLWDLYRMHGINTASASQGVCILKQAARRIAALPDNEAEEIMSTASPVRIITTKEGHITMDLFEAVGITRLYIDAAAHKELSHEEAYDRIIDYLGGLSAIAPYIPYSIKEIKKALKTDEYLNNLPLSKWDDAAGFHAYGMDVIPTYKGLWDLYRAHGINSVSLATGVCILKCAARKLAALPDDEAEAIMRTASPVRIITK